LADGGKKKTGVQGKSFKKHHLCSRRKRMKANDENQGNQTVVTDCKNAQGKKRATATNSSGHQKEVPKGKKPNRIPGGKLSGRKKREPHTHAFEALVGGTHGRKSPKTLHKPNTSGRREKKKKKNGQSRRGWPNAPSKRIESRSEKVE